jgi:hypothetical protein
MIRPMKTIAIILITLFSASGVIAQNFDKHVSDARSAYESGNLENSRFSMEQALRELDILIGKEIIKLLPAKMGQLSAVVAEDQVTASGAAMGAGLFINRKYGADPKKADLQIMNNSPLLAGINALLAIPFLSGDANQKQVKIQGYKALIRMDKDEATGKVTHNLQVPFGNTLLTLHVTESSEAEIISFANLIPLSKISAFAQ